MKVVILAKLTNEQTSPEMLSNLPRTTQLIRGRGKTQFRSAESTAWALHYNIIENSIKRDCQALSGKTV